VLVDQLQALVTRMTQVITDQPKGPIDARRRCAQAGAQARDPGDAAGVTLAVDHGHGLSLTTKIRRSTP
jgi:hypothetical protein